MTRVWARTGSRPRAVHQTKYTCLYVLGAVCPATGNTAGLLAASLNSGVVNVFFEQLIKEIAPGVHVVLVWDRAAFHTTAKLHVPSNVTLVQLPPRSPELNPVENLWHFFRSHYWSNRSYADYDALRAAACAAWQHSCPDLALIKRVCAVPWLEHQRI
jgi:hypothetical protein